MSQPVKISDKLLLDARLMAQVAHRSIAGQIEFWANLGRAIEPLLQGKQVAALSQAEKLAFLKHAVQSGYNVILCFIGIDDARTSEERVAQRVTQGGHDVPTEKLNARFPRILANLRGAIRELPHVRIFDNSDLHAPFRQVAVFNGGKLSHLKKPIPKWLKKIWKFDQA